MKDKDQKLQALKYCIAKRWLPQLEVDVQTTQSLGRRAATVTDLDVYASIPDDFVGYRTVVFDCKTLSRESPVNRSLWLRGVLDRMGADHGFCVLKKNAMEVDHRLAATKLSVILLAEDEFEIYAKATSNKYGEAPAHSATEIGWEKYFAIKERSPTLLPYLNFLRSTYWMQADAGETCRKVVGSMHEAKSELDPMKPEHIAVAVEYAVLLARTLAQIVSFIFRSHLHPRQQHDLEEAVRMLLYGGRDAYEHRNELYRLLKERTGSVSGVSLALPAWDAFIKLVRQLLDAPIELAKAPLILREISFAELVGSTDLQFCRTLCQESPQAGRFSLLIVDYLFKAVRLPPQFLEKVQASLLPQLRP